MAAFPKLRLPTVQSVVDVMLVIILLGFIVRTLPDSGIMGQFKKMVRLS